MGILDWVDVPYEKKSEQSLTGAATKLLKRSGKRKKTRRGSGIKKKTKKQQEHKKLMEQYKQQKRERGEMFKEFERLIAE